LDNLTRPQTWPSFLIICYKNFWNFCPNVTNQQIAIKFLRARDENVMGVDVDFPLSNLTSFFLQKKKLSFSTFGQTQCTLFGFTFMPIET
jgi:hypothetical protein